MTLPLDTAPGPSPDEESARNLERSKALLQQAQQELDRQDPFQAAEKAWGATAHAVKAMAEKRRWFNDADWRLDRIVAVIAEEQRDLAISTSYSAARNAHYDFYHLEYSPVQVQQAINAAAYLVHRLEELLANGIGTANQVSEDIQFLIRRLEQPTSARDHQRLENGRPPIEQRPPATPPTV